MKKFAMLAFGLLFAQLCAAATIQGELFEWETLQKIGHAIIDVNSVPPQRIVAENGSYAFNVPAGAYSITAMQFIDGELARIGRETVIVKSEGAFTLDLILKQAGKEDLQTVQEKGFEAELFEGNINWLWILPIAAIALIAMAYASAKLRKKQGNVQEESQGSEERLDKYAAEVLGVLQRSGNRLTQKELREKVQGCGEAKISLILTELEAMGKIKKIKKGRGNIIVLKGQ